LRHFIGRSPIVLPQLGQVIRIIALPGCFRPDGGALIASQIDI
jgi:hypothetical protein